MRVSAIELYSSDDVQFLSFGLRMAATDDQFYSKALIGLDADEIIQKLYGFSLVNNVPYFEMTLPPREVVMRLVLNPNYTLNQRYSDLRDDLYRSISSQRSGLLKMIFKHGATRIAQLNGFITKFEVPLSSKVPELQLTMRFSDPIIRGVNHVELIKDDVHKGSNDIQVTDATSTAPHGLQIVAKYGSFAGAKSSFIIRDQTTNWQFRIDYDQFSSDDILYISSEYGNAYAYIYKDATATILPLMDKVNPTSTWPILFPGQNKFVIEDLASIATLDVKFRTAYWGV